MVCDPASPCAKERVLLGILSGLISAPVMISSTTSGQYKAFAVFHIGEKKRRNYWKIISEMIVIMNHEQLK